MDNQRRLAYLSVSVCVLAGIVTIIGGIFAIQSVPEAGGGCDPDQLRNTTIHLDDLNLYMTLPLGAPAVLVGGFTIGSSIIGAIEVFCTCGNICCRYECLAAAAAVMLVICTVMQPVVFIMAIAVHDWIDKECDGRECRPSSSTCDCVASWNQHHDCEPWCKVQWEYFCEDMSIVTVVLGALFFMLWILTLLTGCMGCCSSFCRKTSNASSGVNGTRQGPSPAVVGTTVVVGQPVSPDNPYCETN